MRRKGVRRGAAVGAGCFISLLADGQKVRLMNESISDISASVCDRGNDIEGLGEHKRFPFCVKFSVSFAPMDFKVGS